MPYLGEAYHCWERAFFILMFLCQILRLVFAEELLENGIVAGLHVFHVFMRRELPVAFFQHGDRNVGAVVRDPLVAVQCIGKNKSALESAFTLLKPADMVFPAVFDQQIDDLLERFDPCCERGVRCSEYLRGQGHDVPDRPGQHAKFILRFRGNDQFLIPDLSGALI